MKTRITLLLTFFCCAVGIAQNNFSAPVDNPFGLGGQATNGSHPHLVDLDNDGDFDILSSPIAANAFQYFENIGTATSPAYAAPVSNPFGFTGVAGGGSISSGDINGDGLIDIISGSFNGFHVVYINNGTPSVPSFSSSLNPYNLPMGEQQNTPEWVDLDNDGDLDILTGQFNGIWGYFENIGTPTAPNYGPLQNNPLGLVNDGNRNNAFFVDMDGDNDLDLFTGRSSGSILYYENTGTATTPSYPARISSPFGLMDSSTGTVPTLADLDADGDLDLLLGVSGFVFKYFENAPASNNNAPSAVCQAFTVQLNGAGTATITANDVDGGSSDSDGSIASMSVDITNFDCSNVGANMVTLTVTDNEGATSTCTAMVTVEDNTAPQLQNPGTITRNIDPGMCNAIVNLAFIIADNCGATLTNNYPAGNVYPVGTTSVTIIATDPSGNATSQTFDVVVIDNEAPVLNTPADITQNNDANMCGSVVAFTATATDNCGTPTVTNNAPTGGFFPIGTTTVTVTANDGNGNTVNNTFTVTVVDAEAPTINCPADETVVIDENTQFTLPDYIADQLVTFDDNCPSFVTSQTPAPGTILSGGTFTIVFEITDAAGNTATCDFELIVDEVLGVNDLSKVTFRLFPSPATSQITIEGTFDIATVEIYNLAGQKVMASTSETLNIEDLASGMYLVSISDISGNKSTKRFIKK